MRILVPVDGSKASLAAVRHAAAALRGASGEVIMVNVQPRLHSHIARFTSRASREAMREERSARALAEARRLLEASGTPCRTLAASGRIADTVARLAGELQADQIVVGTTRRAGWWQAIVSPVPRILDLSDIPVAVVGEGRSGALERYGVPACVGLGLTALVVAVE